MLERHADSPLHALKTAALDAVVRFAGKDLSHDDVTLLAVEVR